MKGAPERAAAVAMFLRVSSEWSLTDRDAGTLLGVEASTVRRWHQHAPRLCTADCEARAWLLLEIAARGQQYFGRAPKWLVAARAELADESLLSVMLRGSPADLTRALLWLQSFPQILRQQLTTATLDRGT
jgi:hypothetical protein